MQMFRKRPVLVRALQLTEESIWDVWHWIGSQADEWCWDEDEKWISIETLEGTMKAREYDWVIQGISGEFYPCKPDIFAASYEPAGEE